MWQLAAMILRPFAATVAVALAASPSLASAQALTPAESAAVDKVVADGLAATGTPSASVAVVRGGRIVFAKA